MCTTLCKTKTSVWIVQKLHEGNLALVLTEFFGTQAGQQTDIYNIHTYTSCMYASMLKPKLETNINVDCVPFPPDQFICSGIPDIREYWGTKSRMARVLVQGGEGR